MFISIASVLRNILAWKEGDDGVLTRGIPHLEAAIEKQDVALWKSAVDELKRSFQIKYNSLKNRDLVDELSRITNPAHKKKIEEGIDYAVKNSETDVSGLKLLKSDMAKPGLLDPKKHRVDNFIHVAGQDLEQLTLMLEAVSKGKAGIDFEKSEKVLKNFRSHYVAGVPLMILGGLVIPSVNKPPA